MTKNEKKTRNIINNEIIDMFPAGTIINTKKDIWNDMLFIIVKWDKNINIAHTFIINASEEDKHYRSSIQENFIDPRHLKQLIDQNVWEVVK